MKCIIEGLRESLASTIKGGNQIMKIYLNNTTIITNDGTYQCESCSLETVKSIFKECEVVSAIGHESTSNVVSAIVGVPVIMNRINVSMAVDDVMVAFKLNQRVPEGVILTADEIEKIGYSFKIIERIK
jgi:hypothetical protein